MYRLFSFFNIISNILLFHRKSKDTTLVLFIFCCFYVSSIVMIYAPVQLFKLKFLLLWHLWSIIHSFNIFKLESVFTDNLKAAARYHYFTIILKIIIKCSFRVHINAKTFLVDRYDSTVHKVISRGRSKKDQEHTLCWLTLGIETLIH